MTDNNRYYDSTKKHHTIKGFRNIEPFHISHKDVKRWKRERQIPEPVGGYDNFRLNWCQPADYSVDGDAIWCLDMRHP